ncbi:hypothetical protein [Reyranella sp. CPCC 100927]|uniref:hypothetical protein n=1 Tax=Reyranella sp. CPCC 100927 TaxID=2599616 RepID=UPI0011B4123D|nr:hypothetical protein [Reyranella sp. CPCC 100927]TWT10651.1 hypothetical protein FQU96_16165 [Reyranella sp. CPCC 100927]
MRLFMMILLVALLPQTAHAAWYIYCRNDRIVIDMRPLSQMKSGRDDSTICIIGPNFEFGPDARDWVEKNLRKKEGDSCSCR